MTVRELYDNVLSELNKVESPSILLEDFNYFANKGIQQYVNKIYTGYEINQQSTDDLRALKVTSQLEITYNSDIILPTEDRYWYAYLPTNYLHLLNCIIIFEKNEEYESKNTCADLKEKSKIKSLARRLTSDMYPNIMNNAYFKPSYKVPYYFITKINESNSDLNGEVKDLNPKLEIRCGSNKKYIPTSVYIDYVSVPEKITLTYDDLEREVDTTKILEFPEYVCYELVNECVKLIMENASDPRLQTNMAINQTIGANIS